MPRTKGSANKGNLQRDTFLKVRCSQAFKDEVAKALDNQMFGSRKDTAQFIREAISKHILYTARSLSLVNKEVLELT